MRAALSWRWNVIGLIALTILVVVGMLRMPAGSWRNAKGYEYEWIALSLAEGHGYSFPPDHRWLFEPHECTSYGPTAWKEPLYTFYLAMWFRVAGEEWGRFWISYTQVAMLWGLCVLLFFLGRRLYGSVVGATVAALYAVYPAIHSAAAVSLQPVIVGSLFIVGSMILILRCMERPSPMRAIAAGVCLGASALTLAPTVLLTPIAAGILAWSAWRERQRMALTAAILLVAVVVLVISPWTVRNYLAFGRVIPIQTGFGFFANCMNGYVAETYRSDCRMCPGEPAYRAANARQAVLMGNDRPNFHALRARMHPSVQAEVGPAYWSMNEHERDCAHGRQFTRFVLNHPIVTAELFMHKAWVFVYYMGYRGVRYIALAAIPAILVGFFQRKTALLSLFAVAFMLPYVATAPMYLRYRLPIDTVYLVLCVGLLQQLVFWLYHRCRPCAPDITIPTA